MSTLLMVSQGCKLHAVEGFTKNLRRLPVVSSGKPLLEKRRRFRSFHPPPYGVHHSTVDRTIALIETKPIRQMELAWDSGDFYPRITQLEESLLEDHTQDFFSQQPGSALLGQCRPEQVAAVAGLDFPVARDSREFEQVQRAVYGIDGKEARRHGRRFDEKQEIGHVNVRDSPQATAADSPIERGSPGRRKSRERFFLSDIGLEDPDALSTHDGPVSGS